MKLEILVHKTTQKVTIFNVKTTKKIQQFYTKKIIKKQEFDIQKQVKCKKLGTKNKPNLEFSPQKKTQSLHFYIQKIKLYPAKNYNFIFRITLIKNGQNWIFNSKTTTKLNPDKKNKYFSVQQKITQKPTFN
jgi:hypothetical protein